MTEKARRQDHEEAREDHEGFSAQMTHEQAPECATQCDLTGTTTDEADDEAAAAGTARPVARPRRARKASDAQAPSAETATVVAQEAANLSAIEADRIELEAQGFSADEAQRLIDISKRLESSAEARESQAELKRLRFAQWLIERGILDEFGV